jgi:alpha-glucosidase
MKLGLALLLLCAAPASAQVLARPGWAGSGVTAETWWRRAVFYRLDPATFQDSDGDGRGDLGGVAQRVDYLQSLGVDAIILAPAAASPPLSPNDDTGFDDLARAASTHHLRVLVTLSPPVPGPAADSGPGAGASVLAAARSWLTQGAAGFFLDERLLAAPLLTPELLHQLRALTNSFPGDRVLLSAAAPSGNLALAAALRREVQLTASPPLGTSTDADTLRGQVTSAGGLPLLAAVRSSAPDQTWLRGVLAVLLLGSRSAVLLDYGQELGLDTATGNTAPWMQWTPGNRTLPPPPPPDIPKTFDTNVYKPYVPYVPPLPHSEKLAPPPLPAAFVSEKPDPRTLPGFSTATLDPALAAPNGATANVVTEDAQPYSLLNLYRHLIQLHHQNASLHDGTQVFLDHDADGALVWLRRPAPGARTSTTVLAVCNLSSHNLHLGLNRELGTLRVPYGGLRTLATSAPVPFEDSQDIVLPPGGAFLGEFSR